MKQFSTIYNMVRRMALAVFASIILFGCSDNSKQRAIGIPEEAVSEQDIIVEKPIGEVVLEENGVAIGMDGSEVNKPANEEPCFAPAPGSDKVNPNLNLDKYISILEVDKKIKLNEKGTILVWIGLEDYMPNQSLDNNRDSSPVYLNSGLYARITPFADDCELYPNEPVVIEVEPSGSGFRYAITPKKEGQINVYANIEFFEDQDCTIGPRKKETTQNLHVKVHVNYFYEIWSVVWEYFMKFWVAFVALFFGALLFVIRKFVKNKTGYGEEIIKKANDEENDKAIEQKVYEEEVEVETEEINEEEK